jgi:hypothetical protein
MRQLVFRGFKGLANETTAAGLATWSVVLVSCAAVWTARRGSGTGGEESPAGQWLTDGGGGDAPPGRSEPHLDRGVKNRATVEASARPARQMQPLSPHRHDVLTAGRRVPWWQGFRQRLQHRRGDRERLWSRSSTLRQQPAVGQRGVMCRGDDRDTVIAPTDAGRYIVYAVSWDGRLRAGRGDEYRCNAADLLRRTGSLWLNLWKGSSARRSGLRQQRMRLRLRPGDESRACFPVAGSRLRSSIGKDGTVYAGSGDGDYYPERQIYGQSIIGVKQNPATKALELKDWYTPSNAFWLRKRDLDMNVTGPIFDFKGKEYLVQSSKECRLWLLDTSALGGEDHRTPVYRTPLICNEDVNFAAAGTWGALATWEEANGTRWILVPFWGPKHSQFTAPIEYGDVVRGAVAAFKMEDKAGKIVLTPPGSRATWIRPSLPSSPTGSFSPMAAARTPRRPTSISVSGSTPRPTGSPSRRTPRSTRSTHAPARSSGRAGIKSRRSTTSAGSR